jgi:tetratricopeptide (TPR) repeat protein
MRKFAPALALCLVSAVPVLVAQAQQSPVIYKACDKKASPDETSAAQGLFKAGASSYKEGDYAKAIQYWRDALERDCQANLLLSNLANAYEKSGDLDAAIVTLETYLKREPNDPEAPTMQKRIENMRKAKAAAAPATQSATSSAAAKPTATAAPTSTATGKGSAGPGIAPLVVAGVGGVLAITGIVVYAGGKKKITDAEAACPDRNSCADADARDKGNSGRTQVTIGGVLAGVGVLGIGGGLAWYFLDKPSSSGAATAPAMPKRYFLPEIGSGYAGAVVGGRF